MNLVRWIASAALVAGLWMGAATPPAHAQRDDLPPGSYQRTCRDLDVRRGLVFGECQARDGRWVDVRGADVSDCRSVDNIDGRLQCGGGDRDGGYGDRGSGYGDRGSGYGYDRDRGGRSSFRHDSWSYRGGAVLYPEPGCGGRPVEVHGFIVDIGASGMRGGPASIQIDRGVWELCEQPNYMGRCWTVNGDNSDLGRLAGRSRIASIRRLR